MALIGEMHYLTIGGNTYSIPTSGGSTVSVTRALTSGTKTATISVDGTSYDLYAPTPNAGTVTSVRVQATSPIQSSTSTAQSSTLNTTISLASGYGDTQNPYASKTKSYVLAAPATADGVPTFRALVAADIPDLSGTYSTTDEKLKTTTVAFNGTYYPLFGAATSTAETKYYSGNFRYSKTTGIDSLQLGQVSSSSTSKGRLTLCSGPYYTYLDPPLYSTISANQTYTLPAYSGTIALTSDIPTVPTKTSDLTNDSGFITNSSLNNYLEKSYTGSNQTGSIGWATNDSNIIYWFTQIDNTTEDTHSYIGMNSDTVGLSHNYNDGEDSFTSEILVENNHVSMGFGNDSGLGDSYYLEISGYNGYAFNSINNNNHYNIYMPQNKSGTIALTSDIPSVYSSTNTDGYLTMATLPIYNGTVV